MPRLGRPRAKGPSTSGLTTEQDILRAAGQLFCEVGYGSTSTYAIAQAAGISQATMYHYFAGKHAILLALLLDTVHPSVELATSLVDDPAGTPESRLRRLCEYDVRLLVAGEQNLGSLYLLPELGDDEKFAPFHAERDRLYAAYRELVAAVVGVEPGDADPQASLVFGLVESVILRRRREGELAADTPAFTAAAALRLLGAPQD
jgi:AcrR family transcriptional regulator